MKKHATHTSRLIVGTCAGLSAVMICGSGCAAKKEKIVTGNFLMDNRGIIPPPHAKPVTAAVVTPVKTEQLPGVSEPKGLLLPQVQEGDIEQAFVPAEAPTAGLAQPKPLVDDTAVPALDDAPPAAVKSTSKSATAKPAKPAAPKRTYTVAKGDTLSGIGYRYRVDWRDIAAANSLTEKSVIREGQVLALPDNAATTPRAAQVKKTTPKAISASKSSASGASTSTSKATSSSAGSKAVTMPADGVYEVKNGDSLWLIARRFSVKSEDIRRINNLKTDVLQVGQKLRLKDGAAVDTAKPAPAVNSLAPVAPVAPATAPVVTLDNAAPAPADLAPANAAEPAVLLGPVVPAGNAAPAGGDLLPVPPAGAAPAPAGVAPAGVAPAPAGVAPAGVAPAPVVDPAPAPAAAKTLPHAVAAGDSIKQLVAMYGCAEDELLKANPGVKSDADLKPGMTLQVPFK